MPRIYTFLFSVLFFALSTTAAHAQVVPATSTPPSCGATSFTPYVYADGTLHSFDYTLSGTSSLPLISKVGNMQLDVRYSTVWRGATSTKIHVDVPRWNGFSEVTPVVLDSQHCSEQTFIVLLPQAKPSVPTPIIPIAPTTAPTQSATPIGQQPTPKQPTAQMPSEQPKPITSVGDPKKSSVATETGSDSFISRILKDISPDKSPATTAPSCATLGATSSIRPQKETLLKVVGVHCLKNICPSDMQWKLHS